MVFMKQTYFKSDTIYFRSVLDDLLSYRDFSPDKRQARLVCSRYLKVESYVVRVGDTHIKESY